MKKVLKKMKDKMFFKLVEKNPHILEEYQTYKWSVEGKENKLKSWSYIGILNYKHRVLKIENTGVNSSRVSTKRKRKSPRLPYLSGAESELLKRPDPVHFAKQLLQYDIVSFDIFDTLILRPFAQPYHLFMLLGVKHKIVDFMAIRREAEREAREIAKLKKGNDEVTIFDIYEIIEYRTGLDKIYGVEAEFEMELEFCFANPYMKEVFQILSSQGKKIICITDMYLTKTMIEELLKKNGYSEIQDIYVSSENNSSKKDKNLYRLVIDKIGNSKSIVHVGDNHQTDYINAREFNIHSIYYMNVHDAGNKFRADGMSDIISSTYSGIINTHLHNGIRKYSPYYEFGFIYGGLYILGYCKWIYDYVKTNNIDKILFLSRDGDIYKKVFDYMYQDVDSEYVFWSRIANTKYTVENNRHDFLNRMVHHKAVGVIDYTIESLLNSLDLDHLRVYLENYGLDPEEIIHTGNAKIIEKFLVDHWNYVIERVNKNEEIVKDYLIGYIQDSKNIAVVDVGWVGSGGAGIKFLVEDKWKLDCKIHNLVAASRHPHHSALIGMLMTGDLKSYIFSRMQNRDLYDYHSKTNNNTNSIYFELFTQAPYPSFAGFKKTSEGIGYIFDVPEVENYPVIKQVQKGIFDFVKLYKENFSNYEYLFNISGYDAYLPFRMISRDLSYIRRYFGDFKYSRGVIADTRTQNIETLNEIMMNSGINFKS